MVSVQFCAEDRSLYRCSYGGLLSAGGSVNPELRAALEMKSLGELAEMLAGMKPMHNTTDVDSKKRAIRAIEIEIYKEQNQAY